jgi:acetylornithine deacetylase/succinyl-diaminopimelate desuccinylase-like protein
MVNNFAARCTRFVHGAPGFTSILLGACGAAPLAAQGSGPAMVPQVAEALRDAEVQRALSGLDRAAPKMAQGLVTLGAIESPSGKEQARAAEVARRLRAIGLTDVRIDAQPNVIARIPGTSGKAIVFVSTLDDLASIPPLQRAAGRPPRIEGDRVVGPGTNTSSTTEALLAAAEAYRGTGRRPLHDLVFAAVAQEETGLVGMKALYAEYQGRALAFVDILGDGRSITYGALGIHWWRVVARGPGGHSLNGGVPNVNQAIGRAVDRILSLPQPPASDNPRRTILNVAMLQSGAVFNHKPDSGWFSVDIRSLDAETIATNEAAVQRIVADVAKETGLSLTMLPVSRTPGGQIAGADQSLLVRASTAIATSLGLTPRLGNAGSANLNVPIGNGTLAIGIGGERGGGRGQPDEFADIPAMVRTAKHVLLLAMILGNAPTVQ